MAYSYQRTITIDHTKVGLNDTGALPATGFPVEISLSGEWLKDAAHGGHVASANGWDIIFKQDSAQLYHEVDFYDPVAGVLVAHVRVDSLSKADDTILEIFYGDGGVGGPTEDPDNVWDSSYGAVWHLQEASGDFVDSTAYGRDGTDNVSAAGKTGKIASGQEFDGTNDKITIGNEFAFEYTDPFTMSAWIKRDANGAGARYTVAAKANLSSARGWIWKWDKDYVELWIANDYGGAKYIRVLAPVDTSLDWRHYVITYDGSGVAAGVKMYRDGTQVSTTPMLDSLSGTTIDTQTLDLGNRGNDTQVLDGYLDEVRISTIVRDADWVRTKYNNQSSPATFYSLGDELPAGSILDLSVAFLAEIDVAAWLSVMSGAFPGVDTYRVPGNRDTLQRVTGAGGARFVVPNVDDPEA